jgi:hypothetical protein
MPDKEAIVRRNGARGDVEFDEYLAFSANCIHPHARHAPEEREAYH